MRERRKGFAYFSPRTLPLISCSTPAERVLLIFKTYVSFFAEINNNFERNQILTRSRTRPVSRKMNNYASEDDEFDIFENSENDQNIDESDQKTDQTEEEKKEKEERKNIKEFMLLQKKAQKLQKKAQKLVKDVKIDLKKPKFINEEKILLDSHTCAWCNVVYSHKKTVWSHIKKVHPEVDLDVQLKFRVCKYCGKKTQYLTQHEQNVHKAENIPPEKIEVVPINAGPGKKPTWAVLTAKAIEMLG